jgi:adenylate cyclase class 2
MSLTPEYEARFLAIDPEQIAATLRAEGGTCEQPRTLMRRIVFKNRDIEARGGWLRLRDQGEETVLTYKKVASNNSAIDRFLEAEVQVSDFRAAQTLLEAMGFEALRYQENYREEWVLDGVTFDLDTWPDLDPFLEIEGPDEVAVRRAAATLALDFTNATFGSVDEVYLNVLGRDILTERILTFTSSGSD